MNAIDRVIATAKGEIGYLEKATNAQLDDKTANAGSNNWNKYAAFLDSLGVVYNGKKNGYAWCDIFVDYCFIRTFGLELGMTLLTQSYGGAGAGCTYSRNYYKQKGQYHKTPMAGDQIFFTNDGGKTSYHTGLVVLVDNARVYTVEGNTSGASGVVANGGGVKDKSYPLNASYIDGYGRPDYSLVKEDAAAVGQDKFNEMFRVAMAGYMADLSDNDCGPWSGAAREFCIGRGIFTGTGKGADGNPVYAWEAPLTREQAAVILFRLLHSDNDYTET